MRVAIYAGLVTCLMCAGTASAVVLGNVDTFQDGTMQGWDGGGDRVVPTGGPAGDADAFLRAGSGSFATPPHLAVFNEQPRWQGNYTAAGATVLSVDVRVLEGDPLEFRAVLFGGTTQASRATSTLAVPVPADGAWHHVSFALTADAMTLVYPFDPMANLLETVNRIMLRHQSGSPDPGGTPISTRVGFDNVMLTPEPAAPLLCLLGFAMAGHRRRWV